MDPNLLLSHQRTVGFGKWDEFHAYIADSEGAHYRRLLDDRPFAVHLRQASSGAVTAAVATVNTTMETSMERKEHAAYLLQFPISSRLRVEVDGRAFSVVPGEALLISPGSHITRVQEPGCITVLRIDYALLHAALERRLARQCPEPVRFEPHIEAAGDLFAYCMVLMDAMDRGVARPDSGVGRAMELALAELLLSEVPSDHGADLREAEAQQRSRNLDVVTEYIKHNLARPITVSELAENAGTSVRSLQEAFARHLQMGPIQYVRQQRLAQARELLEQAEAPLSIADAARRVGITHLGRFAVWYRAAYGESPSQTLARMKRGARERGGY